MRLVYGCLGVGSWLGLALVGCRVSGCLGGMVLGIWDVFFGMLGQGWGWHWWVIGCKGVWVEGCWEFGDWKGSPALDARPKAGGLLDKSKLLDKSRLPDQGCVSPWGRVWGWAAARPQVMIMVVVQL